MWDASFVTFEPADNFLEELLPTEEAEGADSAVLEARSYYPDLLLDALKRVDASDVGCKHYSLPFYRDYRLVRLGWNNPGGGERVLYGLHAPGDFRAIDGTGRGILRVNDLEPIALTSATVEQYVRFRLAFALGTEEGAEGKHLCRFWAVRSEADLGKVLHLPSEETARQIPKDFSFETTTEWLGESRQGGSQGENEATGSWRLRLPVLVLNGRQARLHRMTVVVTQDGTMTFRDVKADGEAFDVEAGDSAWARPLRRARGCGAIGDSVCWSEPGDGVSGWISKLLEEKAVKRSNIAVREEGFLCRRADLPFYRTYRLVEFLEPHGALYRRTYALVRKREREAGEGFDIRPLDGTSPVIHRCNVEEGELSLGDPGAVDAYLRFFCWAIEGDEGAFTIPRAMRDIPFERAPPEDKLQVLRELEYRVRRSDGASEDSREKRVACVHYGGSIFKAEFAIDPANGMVEMLDDEPLVQDLPTITDTVAADDRAVLKLHEEPSDSKRDKGRRRPLTAEEFITALGEKGVVKDGTISGTVVLDRLKAPRSGKPLQVENCEFEQRLTLRSVRKTCGLVFDSCDFAGGLDAGCARLDGFLTLAHCEVEQGDGDRLALDLEGARLGGLMIRDCACAGRIFAPGALIDGNVLLRGVAVANTLERARKKKPFSEIETDGDERREKVDSVPHFPTSLTLAGAKVSGNLEIVADPGVSRRYADVEALYRTVPCTDARASVIHGDIDLRAEIGGNVTLTGLVCYGDINMTNARVARGVSAWSHFASSHRGMSGAHLRCTNLSLVGARISGELDLGRARLGGDLRLDNAQVGRNVSASGLRTGEDAHFYGTRIAGNLDLVYADIGGGLVFTFGRVGGYVTAFPHPQLRNLRGEAALKVGRDLILSAADLAFVELRGIEVGGKIVAVASRFKRLFIGLGLRRVEAGSDDASKVGCWPMPSRAAGIEIRSTTIEETLSIAGVRIGREEAGGDAEAEGGGGISIEQSQIGGDLVIGTADAGSDLKNRFRGTADNPLEFVPPSGVAAERGDDPLLPEHVTAWVQGDLALSATRVGGRADLRNLEVVQGAIRFTDMEVRLDLLMGAGFEKAGEPRAGIETRCCSLDMEKLQCDGDLRLSGLRVECSDRGKTRLNGDLKAAGAVVRGDIEFVDIELGKQIWLANKDTSTASDGEPDKQKADPEAKAYEDVCKELSGKYERSNHPKYIARIEGDLDLAAVKANRLLLTGQNVPNKDAKLILERSELGRLHIIEPPPAPIDMTGLRSDRWQFGHSGAEDDDSAERYIAVLDRVEPFDRGAWIAVEADLRNEARNAEADQVYRAMRRRELEESKDILQHIIETLRCISGYVKKLFHKLGESIGKFVPRFIVTAFKAIAAVENFIIDGLVGVLRILRVFPALVLAICVRIWGRLNGHGTAPFRLLWVTVFFLAISLLVFSDERRIAPSLELLDALGGCSEIARIVDARGVSHAVTEASGVPEPAASGGATGSAGAGADCRSIRDFEPTPSSLGYEWSPIWDNLAISARYSIPVIQIATHARWVAGHQPVSWLPFGMTAEQFAFLVSLYNWIAWPLVLAFWGNRLLRKGRQ